MSKSNIFEFTVRLYDGPSDSYRDHSTLVQVDESFADQADAVDFLSDAACQWIENLDATLRDTLVHPDWRILSRNGTIDVATRVSIRYGVHAFAYRDGFGHVGLRNNIEGGFLVMSIEVCRDTEGRYTYEGRTVYRHLLPVVAR